MRPYAWMSALALLLAASACAAPRGGRPPGDGWAPDGRWGRHWNPSTVEVVSGTVVAIRRAAPYRGMSMGIHLQIRMDDGTPLAIHLGPAWFVENQELRIRVKDRIRVRGSRARVEGNEVVIASEVRRGTEVFRLRDADGFPLWAAWRSERESR